MAIASTQQRFWRQLRTTNSDSLDALMKVVNGLQKSERPSLLLLPSFPFSSPPFLLYFLIFSFPSSFPLPILPQKVRTHRGQTCMVLLLYKHDLHANWDGRTDESGTTPQYKIPPVIVSVISQVDSRNTGCYGTCDG